MVMISLVKGQANLDDLHIRCKLGLLLLVDLHDCCDENCRRFTKPPTLLTLSWEGPVSAGGELCVRDWHGSSEG